MPTEKLRNTLSSTEQRIKSDITRVLEISQKTNDQLGKHLEDMSIPYESIELAAPSHVLAEIEEQRQPDEVVVLQAPTIVKIKPGFFERLWIWLNSSTRLIWKDIKKYR